MSAASIPTSPSSARSWKTPSSAPPTCTPALTMNSSSGTGRPSPHPISPPSPPLPPRSTPPRDSRTPTGPAPTQAPAAGKPPEGTGYCDEALFDHRRPRRHDRDPLPARRAPRRLPLPTRRRAPARRRCRGPRARRLLRPARWPQLRRLRRRHASRTDAPSPPTPPNVEVPEPGVYSVLLDGRSYDAFVEDTPSGLVITIEGHRFELDIRDPRRWSRKTAGAGSDAVQSILDRKSAV